MERCFIDLEQEIPIEFVPHETSKDYIDRMFNENVINISDEERLSRLILEKAKTELRNDLQRFVSDLVTRNVHNIKNENMKLETENFGLKEQISLYKSELDFLKEELKSSRQLLHGTCQKYSDTNSLDKSSLWNFNFDTPDVSFSSNDKNDTAVMKLQKQLVDVRSQKHKSYESSKVNDILHDNIKTSKVNDISHDNIVTKVFGENKKSETVSKSDDKAEQRKNVFVCGDSIVNGIDGLGLSSKQVKTTVRCFPGSTTDDFIDFIKPIANKKPDIIILHVGTNDLTRKSDTISNLVVLLNDIKSISQNTKLAVSSLCIRKDRKHLEKEVDTLNREIEVFCKANDMDFIKNVNIDSSCLTKKKLHLLFEIS